MKDILDRIDEFMPFALSGVFMAKKDTSQPQAKSKAKMDKLLKDVLYHKIKDRKEALELVIQDNTLDKKTEKQFRKYVKKLLNI